MSEDDVSHVPTEQLRPVQLRSSSMSASGAYPYRRGDLSRLIHAARARGGWRGPDAPAGDGSKAKQQLTLIQAMLVGLRLRFRPVRATPSAI